MGQVLLSGSESSVHRISWHIYALIAILALLVRIPFALDTGFTGDEALCVAIAQCSPWEIMSGQALEDSNPPLFMLLLHYLMQWWPEHVWIWKLAVALINVASVIIIARLAGRWAGFRVEFVAGLLAAINPWHVYLATELRGYALSGFFGVAALDAADRFERSLNPGWALLWSLCVAAGFWTHYSVLVVGLVTGAVVLWRLRRRRPLAMLWCLAGAVAVGLMSLWVPRMLEQSIQRGGRPEHWLHLAFWPVVQMVGTTLVRPGTLDARTLSLLAAVGIAFGIPLIVGLQAMWRRERKTFGLIMVLVAAGVAIPLLRSAMISSLGFSSRYTFILSPVILTLLALGIVTLPRWHQAAVLSAALILMGLSLWQFKFDYTARSAWGRLTAELSAVVQPDEAILVPNCAQAVRLRLFNKGGFDHCFLVSPQSDDVGYVPADIDYVGVSGLLKNHDLLFPADAKYRLHQFQAVWHWPFLPSDAAPPPLDDRYQFDRSVTLLPGGEFGAEGKVQAFRFVRRR